MTIGDLRKQPGITDDTEIEVDDDPIDGLEVKHGALAGMPPKLNLRRGKRPMHDDTERSHT